MKLTSFKLRFVAAFGALMIMLYSMYSHAVTYNATGNVRFVSHSAVSAANPLNYGDLSDNIKKDATIIVNTSGDISGTGYGTVFGGVKPGDMSIVGSSEQEINYVFRNSTSNGSIGLSDFVCKYGKNAEVPCSSIVVVEAPTADGTKLVYGAKATFLASLGNNIATKKDSTFEFVVTYQ